MSFGVEWYKHPGDIADGVWALPHGESHSTLREVSAEMSEVTCTAQSSFCPSQRTGKMESSLGV